MNAIVPNLVNAAGFGSVVGLGVECATNFDAKGVLLATSVITAVALRAIAFFFNVGTAVGASIGVVASLMKFEGCCDRDKAICALGCAIIGGAIGYLLEPSLMNSHFVFLL